MSTTAPTDRTSEPLHQSDGVSVVVGYLEEGREMTVTTCTRCGGVYRARETCVGAQRYSEMMTL